MWYGKVFITGITGYIGSNIARYIVNNMKCQVIGIKGKQAIWIMLEI